mmetsp:Transcript_12467/g.15624  ORF Transcript_12467/g.15624 Transcript_12467/m.15624 type:complete len:236 (-) Transcript_12467:96-803(-)|eukprot:CAMPEP_0172501868 /NCGR_PEP_ID=MMETSP1066-20121228/154575_1 /TAXON_ID=671091 /ORGANISM="Coscinodiscus wailesii, Strain CCMP2513" /LENGTH=235 /DNA_ID=CAMNT_0013276905 /DNA_START=27 /DNA_END=734 /DNA_ORIENTATION=+
MPFIKTKIFKKAKDANIGIALVSDTKSPPHISIKVAGVNGIATKSDIRVGDTLLAINGKLQTNKDDATKIIEVSEGEINFVFQRSLDVKSIVAEEFNGWKIDWPRDNACVIEPRNNPGNLAAFLAPDRYRQYRYIIVFGNDNRIEWRDISSGNANRVQGGFGAKRGNAPHIPAVVRSNDVVTQKVSRMQTMMIADKAKTKAYIKFLNICWWLGQRRNIAHCHKTKIVSFEEQVRV